MHKKLHTLAVERLKLERQNIFIRLKRKNQEREMKSIYLCMIHLDKREKERMK